MNSLTNTRETKMSSITIEIKGILLDIYYDCIITKDSYGTGDSPKSYEIEIHEIELTDNTVNIKELLSDEYIDKIENKIINQENGF